MIAEPPSDAGAVHDTVADASPATAVTPVGAPGRSPGVPDTEFDAALFPFAFTARTVTGYEVPGVSPLIVNVPVDWPVDVQFTPASREYSTSVIAEPPSAPRVATTSSARTPAAIDVTVGASGIGPAWTVML